MMISTKGRYALRIMLDLSQCKNSSPVPLKDIALRQQISVKYMEAIISVLNKAGFVKSVRGKDGGYILTKKPFEYTVGSILKLTEGSLAPVSCLECDKNACPRADKCETLPMWKKLDEIIDNYLESVTLEDLAAQKHATGLPDYII